MNTPSVFFWSITDTSVEYDTSPTDLRSGVYQLCVNNNNYIVPAEFLNIHENGILQLARCVMKLKEHALYRL